MVDVNVCISNHLKEDLAWATDKWLWVISIIMLFKKQLYSTKKLKELKSSFFKFKTILFMLLCGP